MEHSHEKCEDLMISALKMNNSKGKSEGLLDRLSELWGAW
jgi:hypothetical protein